MTMARTAVSPADELLICKEAADYLRLSIPTLERMRTNQSGPPWIRLGRGKRNRIVYRRSDLDGWLRQQTFSPSSQAPRTP